MAALHLTSLVRVSANFWCFWRKFIVPHYVLPPWSYSWTLWVIVFDFTPSCKLWIRNSDTHKNYHKICEVRLEDSIFKNKNKIDNDIYFLYHKNGYKNKFSKNFLKQTTILKKILDVHKKHWYKLSVSIFVNIWITSFINFLMITIKKQSKIIFCTSLPNLYVPNLLCNYSAHNLS